MSDRTKPFTGPPPPEIHLSRAPLVRVIGQITFAPVLSIIEPASLAPFQERVRNVYPLLNQEAMQRIAITPGAPPVVQQDMIWRLHDAAQHWRMSLGTTFVALETPRYTSRADFLARLGVIIAALEQTIKPQITLRIGLRYISRIEGPALARLSEFIKPEFAGAVDTPFGHAAEHVLTESLITTDEGLLQARWGKLPANGTVDPQALEPVATESWIHDLDLSNDKPVPFSATDLAPVLERFAERLYAVFRFMVTEDYLRHYGGKL